MSQNDNNIAPKAKDIRCERTISNMSKDSGVQIDGRGSIRGIKGNRLS